MKKPLGRAVPLIEPKAGSTYVRSLRGFARSSLRNFSGSHKEGYGFHALYLCVGHNRDLKKLASELSSVARTDLEVRDEVRS